MDGRRGLFAAITAATAALTLPGCATLTASFPVESLGSLNIGRTTATQVREILGPPRASISVDGRETWHYGPYRYSPFAQRETRDLVVRFDARNIVIAYTLNLPYPKSMATTP
jgi:outer membrane protein assembly factor BamE (lipoprotein component of BamABCDE complex)